MMFGAGLMLWTLGVAQSASAAPTLRPLACAVTVASDQAAAELCLGEQQAGAAERLPKQGAERLRQFEGAAAHYRRAASLALKPDTRAQALEALAQVYDAQRLNDPRELESVLRELMALQPHELGPAFRLAKLQEDEGLVDAAEDTLLAARRQQPDGVEPYRMLAQFYARRATALHKQTDSQKPADLPSGPGERDENGVYRVGGPIAPPSRLDVAKYPPEAAAAGIFRCGWSSPSISRRADLRARSFTGNRRAPRRPTRPTARGTAQAA